MVEEHSVNSLIDFIKLIKKLSIKAETGTQSVTGNFYRGQRNCNWGLESGLERCKNTSLEHIHNGFDLFKARLQEYYPDSRNMNDFEIMILAQHYGLPTRLLDWTTSPLSALYFAIYRHDMVLSLENDIDKFKFQDNYRGPMYISKKVKFPDKIRTLTALPSVDAAVYVLNSDVKMQFDFADKFEKRFSYAAQEKRKANEANKTNETKLDYSIFYDDLLETKLDDPENSQPILITAPMSFSRIAKQKGVFTIMRSVIKNKEIRKTSTFNPNNFHKIIIKKEAIADIYLDMMTMGYGPTSLFGDIDSLAEEIKFSHFGGFANKVTLSAALTKSKNAGEITLMSPEEYIASIKDK